MKEQSFNSDIDTISPHFDDERTLLTARRVVPLEKINAKVTRRRRWFLGGAFATAMLLGAASALLASYLRLRNAPASEITQVEATLAPLPAEVNVTEQAPTVAVLEETEFPEETEPLVVPVAPKRETTPKRRTASPPESDYIPSRDTPGMSEEDELERIRAVVLYNEWQERRLRRANRRERRRAERASRDLSNLDEIFEGPRQP